MALAQTVKQTIRSDLPDAGIESKGVRRAVTAPTIFHCF